MSEQPKEKGPIALAKEVQHAIGGVLGFITAWFICWPIFWIGLGIYWLSELPREKQIIGTQDGMDRLYESEFPSGKEHEIRTEINFNEDR